MLQKTNNPSEVHTFKLNNGEEIITRIQEDNDDHYVLKSPLCLVPGPNGQLGLAPMLFSVDPKETPRLNKAAVAMQARTANEIAQQYLKQTTGLVLATGI
jgi:hypothetical protein